MKRLLFPVRAGDLLLSACAQSPPGLGYTNIRDVDGGMVAWEKEGYQLVQVQK